MWVLVFGYILSCILTAYCIVDSLVYLYMRKATLDYWYRKEPNQPSFYSYLPLVNLPMAVYFKLKYGDFQGKLDK